MASSAACSRFVSDGGGQALLVDFGGTLDADGVPWAQGFFGAYRAAGGSVARQPFERLFARTEQTLPGLPGLDRLGYSALVWRQAELLASLLGDGVPPRAMAERFLARAAAIVRRNRPVLERLARSMPLVVVSNFTGNLRPCLAELALLPLFSAVVDSTEIGIRKPDPRIFAAALGAVGASPDAAWFVGDNPNADIAPSLALGMNACWLAPASRREPRGIERSVRIRQFPEVEGVLQ